MKLDLDSRLENEAGQAAGMQHSPSFPLTLQQEPLWLYERVHTGATVNNCLLVVHLEGRLDSAAFENALQRLVDEHSPLRSRFPRRMASGVPSYSIRPSAKVFLITWDLSENGLPAQEELLKEIESRMLGKPFDLENDLLIRAEWVKLGPTRAIAFLCIHHLVYDGYSDRVILHDLARFYSETPKPSQARADGYGNMARQQRSSEGEARRQAALHYWTGELQTPAAPLCLPYDYPRAGAKGCPAGVHSILATEEEWKTISAWAKEAGFSPASFLFACLIVCVHQLGRAPHIQVGVNVAGRHEEGQRDWVGLLMSVLPLRVAVDDSLPVSEFCKGVRRQLLESMKYREYSFIDLLKQIPVPRGQDSFFEVLFNYQEIGPEVQTGADFRMWRGDTQIREVDADLVLNVMPSTEGRLIRFFYNQELFRPETIARLATRYWHMLHEMMVHPTARLRDISMLPVEERRDILILSKGDERPEFLRWRLHDLFLQGLPDESRGVAIRDSKGEMTYQELEDLASQVASTLRARGFDKARPIGVMLRRSREYIAAVLGILMAGGAYLPVDVNEPEIRRCEMLEDGNVEVIICESSFPSNDLALMHRKAIRFAEAAFGELEEAGGDRAWSSPEDLAYVVFTSGSTGRAKGVLGHHRGAVNYLLGMRELTKVGKADRILQFAGVNFDGAIEEIFLAFTAKATLVLPPPDLMESFSRFDCYLRSQGITFLSLPASFWQRWLAYLEAGGKSLPPTLRVMLVGFEKVQASSYALWQKISKGSVLFVNGYGPTEASIYSTAFVAADTPSAKKVLSDIPIGRPMPNEQVYLLDDRLELVPRGGTGEIYIGGAGVALGYAGHAESHDGCFIADPFSSSARARLYRTGDMGRWNHEGLLEIHGRRDQQVKIRGFRVELSGVEAVILGHPRIQEAAVCVKSEGGAARLAAFVVGDITSGELKGYLSARLPSHMVPAAVMMQTSLPRRANGKVDRTALTSLALDQCDPVLRVAPRNVLEEKLAEIWLRELGGEGPGVYENFFEAGGDSVSALALLAGLEETFGVHFPVHVLFERPTIAQLAEALHLATHHPRAAGGPEWYLDEASQHVVSLHSPDALALARPPVFIVPGGWGGENEMLVFVGLAKRLKGRQQVYGLNARLMSSSYTPPEDVSAKAARYLEDMRKARPYGPYQLVGECLGGAVALEMAHQIEMSGGIVDRLIVLDYVPLELRPGDLENEKVLAALESWLDVQPPQVASYLRELRRYRSPILHTPVVAIFSEEMRETLNGLIEEWQSLAGEALTVHTVPGSHDSYLRQEVASLASVLDRLLDPD